MPSNEEINEILQHLLDNPIHDIDCGRGEDDEPAEASHED